MAVGGALALGASASAVLRRGPEFAFEDIPGLPGFRRLVAGDLSRGLNPLAAVDALRNSTAAASDTSLCEDLWQARDADDLRVPVASFSDYNCPYCRILTPELASLETEGLIVVTWHELPLLGDPSRIAARAALAADVQGQYIAFHNRLMRARFVPNTDYVLELATSTRLDLDRFRTDFFGTGVTTRIATSIALAEVLGLPGTPSLVVGRTVVIGAIPIPRLKRLISLEASEGTAPCPT